VSLDVVAGLATGNKIGLALVAGLFIVFALVTSMLVPRYRPDFPTGRGLSVFVLVSVVFFLGTMTAVFTLGKEAEPEAHAATTEAETGDEGETQETAPATTSAGNAPTETITVTATEFKLTLDKQPTGPGNYEFVLKNAGKIGHDLVVEGPHVDDAKTPVTGAGASAKLRVPLEAGTYKLYCDVPGHEEAGMRLELRLE
jgi:uncharacterized cupredoxin-like copper-binding protein